MASQRSAAKSVTSQRSATAAAVKEVIDPALAPMNAEVNLDAMMDAQRSMTMVTQTEEGGLEVETVVSSHHTASLDGGDNEEIETVVSTKETLLDDDGVTAVSF